MQAPTIQRRLVDFQTFVILVVSCHIALPQSAQPQPTQTPSPPITTIILDEAKPITDPASINRMNEEWIDLSIDIVNLSSEGILINNGKTIMDHYLKDRDLDIEKTIQYKIVVPTEHNYDFINARSSHASGTRKIEITLDLYRYLDKLVTAIVMGQQANARECVVKYTGYLLYVSISAPVMSEILEPEYFADHNPQFCPQFPHPTFPYTFPPERNTKMYDTLLQDSFLFVMLHEFAHQRNGDVDVPRPMFLDANWYADQKRREKAADDYAIDFFLQHKSSPLLGLPAMFLIATIQDFPLTDNPRDEHPSTLSRMQDMFDSTKHALKSKKFEKWLKQQPDPDAIQTRDQFIAFMKSSLLQP